MLDEVIKYLVEEQQREERARARRSIQLAKRIGIGPFRRAATVTEQIFSPSEFFYDAPRDGKPGPLSAPSSLECHIKDIRLTISNTHFVFKDSDDNLDFTMLAGGLDLFISVTKMRSTPEAYFTIRNAKNQYWCEDLLSMNKQMITAMVAQLHHAIENAGLIQSSFEDHQKYYSNVITTVTPDTLKKHALAALEIVEENLPEKPLIIPKRRSNEARAEVTYHSRYLTDNGHHVYPEASFEDTACSARAIPIFENNAADTTIRGIYGAFDYQRHGVQHWVQFKNIDGTDTADFMIISPHGRYSYERPKRMMYQKEAISALAVIRDEMKEQPHQWTHSVLDRLEIAAKTLPAEPLGHSTPEEIKRKTIKISKILGTMPSLNLTP